MASRTHCVRSAALRSLGSLFSLGCFRVQVSVVGVTRTLFSQSGSPRPPECGGPSHLLMGQVGPGGALGLVVSLGKILSARRRCYHRLETEGTGLWGSSASLWKPSPSTLVTAVTLHFIWYFSARKPAVFSLKKINLWCFSKTGREKGDGKQRCWLFRRSPSPILVSHPVLPTSSPYDSKPSMTHRQARPRRGAKVAHVGPWDLCRVVVSSLHLCLSPWTGSCRGSDLKNHRHTPIGGSRESLPEYTHP